MAVPSTATLQAPAQVISLYIGDLHPDVTEQKLSEVFSDIKSLVSIRVCMDSATGRSLSYGYINLLSFQEAQHVIETKNHRLVNGKMVRIMWSIRDPDTRKSGVGNVFVKNLSETMDNVGLQELFRQFGNVLSCKVATFEDGKSKCYGFVQFETQASANTAIEKLNGSTIDDKQIYVGKFMKKSDRMFPSPDAKYTNLYVKNLDLDVTEEFLQEKFSQFGKIASLVISKDEDGNSRGFGFVNFDSPDDAKRAFEAMNGSQLGSKILYVARAQKKAEREQLLRRKFEERRKEQIKKCKASNVYVKNINDDVTDEDLREVFSQCGRITSAKIMRDNKGLNKGFGFVCFSAPDEAKKAVSTFHGYMFYGKPLYVAIAQRKEDRQAQFQLHYVQCMAGYAAAAAAGPSTAVIPGGYPPVYYTTPSGVVPQVPPRAGMMYQPLGLRPGWSNGYAPPASPAAFQTSLPLVPPPPPPPPPPCIPRQTRQNRGRMMNNGYAPMQSVSPFSYVALPHAQHLTHSVISSKDHHSNQQRSGQAKYVSNGGGRDINRGSGVPPAAAAAANSNSVSQGTEILSSMLAAASPEQQKTILGERLYPLIQKHQPDLVPKITGMLLEMDNSELLLLLESPESLAAKVEEAVEVLKISNAKVSGQDGLHPSFLSAQVAVN